MRQGLADHLPDIANAILERVNADPALTEALEDFERACAGAEDDNASAADRTMWAEIREELASEIRRIVKKVGAEGTEMSRHKQGDER